MWNILAATPINFLELPLAFWIVFGALALVLLISYVLLPLIALLRRSASPLRQVRVTVLTTQRRNTGHVSGIWRTHRRGWLNSNNWSGTDYDDLDDIDTFVYSVIVETDDTHQRLEFDIPEAECGRYQPDDAGLLTYRYDRILQFIPSAPAASPVPSVSAETPQITPDIMAETSPVAAPETTAVAAIQDPNELGEWDWTQDARQPRNGDGR